MWALIENNPTMGVIVGVVIVVTILLHVGFFMVIRHLGKRDRAAEEPR